MVELNADEWIVIQAPHLGDTYFTCALAEALLARHGGNLVRIVVAKKFWNILKLFPDARIEPVDPAEIEKLFPDGLKPLDPAELKIRLREPREFRRQSPLYIRPVVYFKELDAMYAGKSIPFTRMYHDLLDLPFPSFARPRVSEEARQSAERRLRELDFPPGKTAILVPISNSLTKFTTWFWEEVAMAFAARGYTIAMNVAPNEAQPECIFGSRPLPIPIEELIPIAELAGTVLAARSGVCDVLSSAQTDLRIVYQRRQLQWKPMPNVDLQWDLGVCGLEDHATYYRMGSSESQEDFITRIAEGIQEI